VTLAARPIGRGDARGVVISVCEAPAPAGGAPDVSAGAVPALVLEIVRELAGEVRMAADPLMGRTTAIRLDVARG
jgi:hypothetical protein